MLEFQGDLSIQDAEILETYARNSKSILEFGVGGSSQIFSQCLPERLICVDTNNQWIEAVKNKINTFGTKTDPEFIHYTNTFNESFDLIFVDGVDELRNEFALETWKYLKDGGVMIFHDTRRVTDIVNVCNVFLNHFLSIESIQVNANHSNMTIITKKPTEPYVNWNLSEGFPMSRYNLMIN